MTPHRPPHRRFVSCRALPATGMLLALLLPAVSPSAPAYAQDEAEQQERFMTVMSQYLDFSEKFSDMAKDRQIVLLLTIEGIVEMHKARGETRSAIEHLRRLLDATEERPARNLLRLKIIDLLKETAQVEEALKELDQLWQENTG